MLFKRLTICLLILSMSLFFACSSSTEKEEEEVASNLSLIQPTVDAMTSAGKGAPITSSALFDNLNNTSAADDYFVVSVRSNEHYQLGHIPGAINIPWRTIAADASLAQLPMDKKIAIYCYTGHTGAIATTVLNALGYDAYNLKFGIMAWTKNAAARAQSPFTEDAGKDFATETTVNTPGTYELADPDFVASQDAEEIMKAAALAYVADGDIAPVISAQSVFEVINDGNASNDPQIVSVRAADIYAIGHIPGAINIPWKTIANEENLKKLDPNRDIVVYCYTGHTGGVATTALRLLGYKAVNMKHGMCDWTKNAAVRGTSPFTEDAHGDYAINTGVNP